MYIIMKYVHISTMLITKQSAAAHLISVELKTYRKMNRRWVTGGGGGGGGGGEEKSFSVMQWNILAQTLAVNGNFQFATKEILDWQHRKDLIIKVERKLLNIRPLAIILSIYQEILEHNPDIGCLEEVDCFHLIKEELQSHGYQGFFVPKPKSPCLKYEVKYRDLTRTAWDYFF